MSFLFKNNFAISGQSACLTAVKPFMTRGFINKAYDVLSLSVPPYASFLLTQQSFQILTDHRYAISVCRLHQPVNVCEWDSPDLSWSIAEAHGTERPACFYCVLVMSGSPALGSALWPISCSDTLSPAALSPQSASCRGQVGRGLTLMCWCPQP